MAMRTGWTRSSSKSHSSFPTGSYVATGHWGVYVISRFGGSAFQIQLWFLEPERSRAIMAKKPWKWVVYSGLSSLQAAKDIAEDYESKATEAPTREAWLENGHNPRPLDGFGASGPNMGSMTITRKDVDVFTEAYIEAALWSSTDNDGEPLDHEYNSDNLDADTKKVMKADCKRFLEKVDAAGLLEHISDSHSTLIHAGHDFWLTRNHHGAGFWDGDWQQRIGDDLTEIARLFGDYHLFVGDDGEIHGARG
jgi:hypothetical protein